MTTSRTRVSSLPPTSSISAGRRRRISSTTASGNAKVEVPQRTNSACEMISVSGTLTVKQAPRPGSERTSISPFSAWTLERTTSRPTPRPASSDVEEAVEKPGRKRNSRSSRSLSSAAATGDSAPDSISDCADAFVIDAAAVVFDFDENVIAAMVGAHRDAALFRLAGGWRASASSMPCATALRTR